MLTLVGLNVHAHRADLSAAQRNELVDHFNDKPAEYMVLMDGSTGLDLHAKTVLSLNPLQMRLLEFSALVALNIVVKGNGFDIYILRQKTALIQSNHPQ